jgi:uncharacterized protein
MEKQISFKNQKSETISGYLHYPEKEASCTCGIILSHCFTCSKHVKLIRKLCDTLSQHGFLVLRYDFSGSGESQGKFEDQTYSKDIEDFNSGIKFLNSQGAKSIGALGHSIGSAVTILAGSKHPEVKCLVTMGGDSSTQGIEKVFNPKVLKDIKKKGKCTFKIFGKEVTITKKFFDDAESHSIYQVLKKSKKPLLIIHGEKDEIIDVDNARKLYFFANEPKDIRIIKGGDHMFTKRLEVSLTLAKNWFEKYLK